MGNRAVIATEKKDIGVYLHWNGGRDSVEPFLAYCEMQGYRSPSSDCYGWARLCQTIGNYFDGGLSLGIDQYNRLDCDNYDNGVYIIQGWDIVGREFMRYGEQSGYDFKEFLLDLDKAQPAQIQLSNRDDWDEMVAAQLAKRTFYHEKTA